jgi:hypothetical protein
MNSSAVTSVSGNLSAVLTLAPLVAKWRLSGHSSRPANPRHIAQALQLARSPG